MKKILLSLTYLLPALAFAQNSVEGIIDTISNIINILTPIVVALALLYFFYGLARYILAAGDETQKVNGKNIMIWGIIALFVMVSVWGVVGVLGETLDIEQGGTVDVPFVDVN